eukprot:GHRR01018418.1.p1 GENE.GHRR01018418.1~~GHRR01018418.1.p1  ORF type:complete len:109 (-),score=12.77 GHRR01018418.1:781-1107(-)
MLQCLLYNRMAGKDPHNLQKCVRVLLVFVVQPQACLVSHAGTPAYRHKFISILGVSYSPTQVPSLRIEYTAAPLLIMLAISSIVVQCKGSCSCYLSIIDLGHILTPDA